VPAAPVSGAPVSAAPVSAAPVSAAPVSAAPVSASPASAPPVANGRTGLPARRGPGRAEDIIGAATAGSRPANKGTRWWSKDGGGGNAQSAKPAPAPRAPVTAGTSGVGLPIRVPMAQLPGENAKVEPVKQPVPVPHGEPDPAQVSSMLTRFYSGVHRAANEDDVPTVPITDHLGARRDPEPTST
jgi:hypothetical protein